jgi:hypothetical protein
MRADRLDIVAVDRVEDYEIKVGSEVQVDLSRNANVQ